MEGRYCPAMNDG